MIPFVIVADLRTGSTLLSSSLDRHPEVRCYGELLHPRDLPDNQLPDTNRYQTSGEEIVRRALRSDSDGATGFRAMVFLPLEIHPQWADAWSCLREMEQLRVIYLTRRNALAQYASAQIAQRTGAYHPSPGDSVLDPARRPTLRVDPDELRRWIRRRQRLYRSRRALLQDKPSLELAYEEIAGHWSGTMRRVQDFLGVTLLDLEPAKQKQESRSLREVITNYEQVADFDVRSIG